MRQVPLTCHKYDRLRRSKKSTNLAKFSTDFGAIWTILPPALFQKSEKSAIFGPF
jgi:hypothetical protein